MITLRPYQVEAIEKLQNGSILCGGVGSGKSITAIVYYILRDCQGSIKLGGEGRFTKMKDPKDLYIITTAKKRDSHEWEKECSEFAITNDRDVGAYGVKVTVDSWNNIKKYRDVFGAFFIFDEQRVVGRGAWVKAFLDIARKNHWILLSATPGDQWTDYIPVFVANGFYRNRTDFTNQHCQFSRVTKYPKIERYIGEELLEYYRDQILVKMEDDRETTRINIKITCNYDKQLYRTVMKDRWDPYENKPIPESGKWVYLLRKVVNSDQTRIEALKNILLAHDRVIIFYNYTYELEMLRDALRSLFTDFTEWNGEKHQEIPKSRSWAYLVQYTAGCEGWNCIDTDTMVFFSQTYSYRTLEQASGRIDRINTPYKKLYYYHLKSTAPIDLAINNALKNKKIFNEHAFGKRNW